MFVFKAVKTLLIGDCSRCSRKRSSDESSVRRATGNVQLAQGASSSSFPKTVSGAFVDASVESSSLKERDFLDLQGSFRSEVTLISLDQARCHLRFSKEMHELMTHHEMILETALVLEMRAIFSRCHRSDTVCFIDGAIEEFYRCYKTLETNLHNLTERSRKNLTGYFEGILTYLSILQQFSYYPKDAHESDFSTVFPHFHPSFEDCCRDADLLIKACQSVILECAKVREHHGSKKQAARHEKILESVRRDIQASLHPIQVYLRLMEIEGGFVAFTVIDFHKVLKVQVNNSHESWLKEAQLRAFVLKCRARLSSLINPIEYQKAMERAYALINRACKTSDHHDFLLAFKQLVSIFSLFHRHFFERSQELNDLIVGLDQGSLNVRKVVEATGWEDCSNLSASKMLHKLKFCRSDLMCFFWSDYERVLQGLRLICRNEKREGLTFNMVQNLAISSALEIVLEEYKNEESMVWVTDESSFSEPLLKELEGVLRSIDHICEERNREEPQGGLFRKLEALSDYLQKFSEHLLKGFTEQEKVLVLLFHYEQIYLTIENIKAHQVNLKRPYQNLLDLAKRICQSSESSIACFEEAIEALDKIKNRDHRLLRVTLDVVEACDEGLVYFDGAQVKKPIPDLYNEALECLRNEYKKRLQTPVESGTSARSSDSSFSSSSNNSPPISCSMDLNRASVDAASSALPVSCSASSAANFETQPDCKAEDRDFSMLCRMEEGLDRLSRTSRGPIHERPQLPINRSIADERSDGSSGFLPLHEFSRDQLQRITALLRDPRKMLDYLRDQGFTETPGARRSSGSHLQLMRVVGDREQKITFLTHRGAEVGKRAIHRILKSVQC